MLIIGLTGGIGMGKSTVAKMFASLGIPAFNADDAVHALQAPNGKAIPAIAAAFPGTVQNGVLDRAALRNIVLADPAALKRLEKIMHPLVRGAQKHFCSAATRQRRRAILLDIPLLFESSTGRAVKKTIAGGAAKKTIAGGAAKKYIFGGANKNKMHLTLTVSCPRDVQINRVAARGKMSPEQIATIIAKQMPDAEKRRRADVTIRTGLSRFHTLRTVRRLVKDLL